MSFLIPAEHLIETDSLIAFYHPRPSYPFHVVIVARDQTPTFCEMQNDSRFWYDLPAAVRELVARFQLNERGYRLITNGGRYQDVPLLHCHLVSGDADQD
ncbi:MAG: HIT domain-containing protein [Anaerolineaceae bacterium]|nr:HIT domain-containing protein [Anaerolineaceae bacterium]